MQLISSLIRKLLSQGGSESFAIRVKGDDMELNTFGVIIRFAIEKEREAMSFYKETAQNVKDPNVKEALLFLSKEAKKHVGWLERIRQEHVAEMILEPITGLRRRDYEIEVKLSGNINDNDINLLTLARQHEKKIQQFYLDAALKISIPEVRRIFKKLAEEKAKWRVKLESLKGPGM